MKKFTIVLLLMSVSSLFAQEAPVERPDISGGFWFCPGAETAMFTPIGTAYGGGLTLGYSRGATIGFKAAYLINTDGLSTLEFNFLFRWYFFKSMRYSGLFIQFMGGPVFCFPDNTSISVPAEYGTISAGLSAGWRFLLGRRWFLEPSVRAGYPYLAGVGISTGMRL